MPELFQKMYYGPNVQNLVESDDCKVMRLSDNSGEGMMTLYHVFPGVFLMYNDFHMKECVSGFQTDMDLLCIDHCREGRIEQEVGQNAFSYLEAGNLRVDRRIHHSGKVEFPLCHYHGISIGFQVETAAKEIPASMKGFSVDLYELQKKYCSDRTPYVIPGEPAIEHIFSELYNVPVKIKKDYFKIKVLELLLYLDALARLEKGYDTPAGDAGKRLSGGEKQRIAIARAILKNAPIVILDEATAFTDPQNEDKIQKSIMALSKGKTLLVIAHRLSTIQNADQIVVLKKGQIVDCGKQGELLERCPLYADMWQAHIGAKNWSVGEKKEVAVNV